MHVNKTNGKKYVGITKQTPNERWRNGSGYKGMVFYKAISKYGWDGFSHEIIDSGLTHKEACDLERKLIAQYNTTSKDYGYNCESGGTSGYEVSEETRKKIGSYQKGKTLSLEHRQTLSNCNSNKNKENWSEAKLAYYKNRKEQGFSPTSGKRFSEESKEKMRQVHPKTPFIAISEDGEITEWDYMRQCAKELGLQHTHISRCLRGLAKKHKGYTFILKEEALGGAL